MLLLILGLALLFCGQPALSEEKSTESKPDSVTISKQQLADFKLDSLLLSKVSIETDSARIAKEEELLRYRVESWERKRQQLQNELNLLFGCRYDLDERHCEPKLETK